MVPKSLYKQPMDPNNPWKNEGFKPPQYMGYKPLKNVAASCGLKLPQVDAWKSKMASLGS